MFKYIVSLLDDYVYSTILNLVSVVIRRSYPSTHRLLLTNDTTTGKMRDPRPVGLIGSSSINYAVHGTSLPQHSSNVGFTPLPQHLISSGFTSLPRHSLSAGLTSLPQYLSSSWSPASHHSLSAGLTSLPPGLKVYPTSRFIIADGHILLDTEVFSKYIINDITVVIYNSGNNDVYSNAKTTKSIRITRDQTSTEEQFHIQLNQYLEKHVGTYNATTGTLTTESEVLPTYFLNATTN